MTKILLIEDEEAIRENILELLIAKGFEVLAAENGYKGIEMAREGKPDLIICDITMPEMDGYGVLEVLRTDSVTGMIPFIFLTALADKTNTRKGMELGADDYLTKPCRPMELLNAIAIRLEKQAAVNKRQAERLEELRDNITFSLPHELRTPLNGILGFSELLLGELSSPDQAEIREMVQQIQFSGNRLYRLIQNFLLYAELELIAVKPERVKAMRSHRVENADVVIGEQAIKQAEELRRRADLRVQLENAMLPMSSNRLRKLVQELIDNAFKFSALGTPVDVITEVRNDCFVLTVSDRGRGMTAEQIANLGAYMQFERRLYEQQGSGLGLAIAKRLAELHGGSLTVESIYGEETVVKVILPIFSGYVASKDDTALSR